MARVSDYIADFLAEREVSHFFMLAGGSAMHLNDSLGHHPALRAVCCHHEPTAYSSGRILYEARKSAGFPLG